MPPHALNLLFRAPAVYPLLERSPASAKEFRCTVPLVFSMIQAHCDVSPRYSHSYSQRVFLPNNLPRPINKPRVRSRSSPPPG